MQVLHRADHFELAERLVSHDRDLADFYLGTLIYVEHHFQRRWRDLPHLGFYGGELTPTPRKIFLNDHGGARHFVRIVRRFDREPHFACFEAIQNFRHRKRLDAFVLDRAHYAALCDDPGQCYAAVGAGFAREPDVVETAAVPQLHEVAMQVFLAIDVALLSADESAQNVLRHAPRAAEVDRFD